MVVFPTCIFILAPDTSSGQKRGLDPLEPELQVFSSQCMSGVKGVKLGSSGRAASADHWAILLAPDLSWDYSQCHQTQLTIRFQTYHHPYVEGHICENHSPFLPALALNSPGLLRVFVERLV